MKNFLLITLISTMVVLYGCGKKNDFKAAINKSVATDYSCLNLNSSSFVPYIDNKEFARYKKDNDFVIINEDQISMREKNTSHSFEDKDLIQAKALVSAGLLTETIKVKQAINSADNKPVHSTVFDIHLYKLTELGKQTIKEKHVIGLSGVASQKRPFCYAHQQVTNIINYNEFDSNGQKVVDIKYSYKLVDIANWTQIGDIQAAFPDMRELLLNNDKIAEIYLVKTNNGWQPHL